MIPKYLYHYTSLDTVKIILENKTIKFNRLDLMNDPLEGIITIDESKKLLDTRRIVYCSCWSEESEESMSMWGIYNRFKGVRIKARSDLFAKFNSYIECENGFIPVANIKPVDSGKRATVDGRKITINNVYGPVKITYEDDEHLKGCIAKSADFWATNEPQVEIKVADLGNHKNRYWAYEKEWRYKLSAISRVGAKTTELQKNNNADFDMREVYLPYVREFEEIVLGPETEDKELFDFKLFLLEKGLSIPVRKSNIRMRDMH